MNPWKAEPILLMSGALLGAVLIFLPWQLILLACVFGVVIGLMGVSAFLSKRDRLKEHMSTKVDRIAQR